jgi:acetyltransferase-like isoleucine patch superfamily enzyme
VDIQQKERIPTRTGLKGKKTVRVPVAKIKPTNTMDWEIEKITFYPILLVKDDDDGSYYIVDGNHRFFTALCNPKSLFISAWVLEEGDQRWLRGEPLPTYVREWRDGLFDLRQLCLMARNVHRRIESDVNEDLNTCRKAAHQIERISEDELESILNQSGFVSAKGDHLLGKMGIIVGKKVKIGKRTIHNLVNWYNTWEQPQSLIIKDNVQLWDKAEALIRSCKMGIEIGEGTKIGDEVSLGLGVSIGKECEIMDGCELCIFSTIGDRVYLGKAVLLGEGSDVESGSRILDRVIIAPRNVVRKDSFIPSGVIFDESKTTSKF